MAGFWESDRKINIARNLLIKLVDSLQHLDNVQLALRVYGHQSPVPPQDCSDTHLEVPFSYHNASRIKQRLRWINPKGTTPIAYSLSKAAGDFPECDKNECRNIILLITDGIEACDGDPCEVSLDLQRQGIILKPFVIGIGIDEGLKQTFECVGQYYNAPNEEKFKEVLDVVISQALNQTTAQVNLLDSDNNATETNVGMTFFDKLSDRPRYHYIHTINAMGNPDTLILDHLTNYWVQVHTIPPVFIDSLTLTPGKHTVVGVKAAQGDLFLKNSQSSIYRDLKCLVRKTGKNEILTVMKLGETEKLLTGYYDLEFLTLPRLQRDSVEITQSTTTKVEIPNSGIVTILMDTHGYGTILRMGKNGYEWIATLKDNTLKETKYFLPGDYRIIYRAKNANQVIYSSTKKFKVKSGSSITIRF